jgi:hypothetical protein
MRRASPDFYPPRRYLFVSADEPVGAAAAVWEWSAGPPDLCVTSPSAAARETAAFACAGHAVRIVEEPLLAGRDGDSAADFEDRFAEALRVLLAFDTRTALVVCDDLPPSWAAPLAAGEAEVERRATQIEHSLPRP